MKISFVARYLSCCAVAGAILLLSASDVRASFILGTAVNYGILVEPGAGSFQLNNSTVNGTVGIGANIGGAGGNTAKIQIASNGFIKVMIYQTHHEMFGSVSV
jgi:hypothetical protein